MVSAEGDPAGTLRAMKQPRLKDVAEAAGVHVATASRALDDRRATMVRPETVARVRTAAADLGYRVNRMARGLKMSRSFTIGMLIPDITNPFFPPVVRGAEDALAEGGYTLVLANTDNDDVKERRHLTGMLELQVDGLLLAMARRRVRTAGTSWTGSRRPRQPGGAPRPRSAAGRPGGGGLGASSRARSPRRS